MFLFPILQLKGYPIHKAKRELSKIQAMGGAPFNSWQEDKKWEMARHHYQNNSVYRSLFKNGLPGNWNSLPIITKSDLQQEFSSLITQPYKRREVYVGNTSGSSGTPFFYAKDKHAHAMTYALIANRYAWHGLSLSQKQGRFYGIPLDESSKFRELLKDKMANRVRFPVFDLSDQAFEKIQHSIKSGRIKYLYGYTSALVAFARYVKARQVVLKSQCPLLSACIVTSEMCVEEDKMLLEQTFGVPIINEYGASELDIIAFTAANGDWKLSRENLFVEILDDQGQAVPNGQEGRMVITSLHNRAFPMVRYDIGDLGALDENKAGVLKKLSGRSNDLIHLPSGKKAAGLTFYYISRRILESGGSIKEFIIRQTALNRFEFDIKADKPMEPKLVTELHKSMSQYLENDLELQLHYVTDISRPAGQKIKHFYVEIRD